MNVYPDHNFLIYCVKNSVWRKAVTEAQRSGKISLVLSPWHFYEYGNAAGYADTENLIQFAEELQPQWTMERGDLQLFEFWIVWEQVWSSSKDTVEPIGTFSDIAAVLSKVHYSRTAGLTMRDYVAAFAKDEALREVRIALDEQEKVATSNQKAYVQGRFDERVRAEMELRHLAVQRARWEIKSSDPDKVYKRACELVREQPIAAQMQFFIECRFPRDLKCYQTEGASTQELYASGGKLNANRFVDRQHVSIALPYCDQFITDDGELFRRCERIKKELWFPTAGVMKGQEFIDLLKEL